MSDPAGDDKGRLRGWSQRKLAAKRQDVSAEEPVEDQITDAPEEPTEDPEIVAKLPALDDITEGSDITPFFAKGVPAHLKNAALRKLWQASPAVRDYLDPAVDYAWDWNAPGGVPGGGGTLSEQSVVKMVKDLIGKGADETAEAPATSEAETPEKESQVVENDEKPDPVAVRHEAPKGPGTAADHAPDRDESEARLTLRRHGRARPE